MSIESKIKKEIAQKWNFEFFNLSQFNQNKLYKVLGPIVGGIEIFNQPRSKDYRPYIVWYPLWKSNLKKCFSEPIILQEIRNKKGMLYDIPYLENDTYIEEVIISTKEQLFFSFSGHTHIIELFKLIDSQFSHTLIKSSPTGQAILLEGKFLSAVYVNDIPLIAQVWTELFQVSKSWATNLFEWKYGKLDDWLQSLQEIKANREEFLKQIEANKQDKKISQLKSSELIL